jgi:hypothetical protein
MLLYREQLRAPMSWWLAGGACVLILGTLVWAGFSVAIGIAVYLVMGALVAAALLAWGAITIKVSDSALTAGKATLGLDQIGEVSAMDAAQTVALRGRSADPAALLLIRPYLAQATYVAVAGRPASQPYWLLGTRRPAELAAAIQTAVQTARSRAGLPATCDDDEPNDHDSAAGDSAAGGSARSEVDTAQAGKDGNAR